MSLNQASGSAYDRLLQSGKQLFAARGYGNTSTIMIARAAGTSESQLVKHFGSKDGLLAAIFDRGWQGITQSFVAIQDHGSPGERLRALIEQVVAGLERDPELKNLMLLEGRRIRREGNEVMLTSGYQDFVRQCDEILATAREQGLLLPELPLSAVRAAIMGMCEGMMREQVLAERQGGDAGYTAADMRRVIDMFLAVFISPQRQTTPL
jgi:AcrR family transcriptional regulator